MNLTKLFEAQALLDADIVKRHPVQEGEDRLSKKILALLVELGECANEFRGFKFWSNKQRPRTEIFVECEACLGTGDANYEMIQEDAEGIGQHEYIECVDCEGSGSVGPKNPLLEEYVDCLHFALSIGNDLKISKATGLDEYLHFSSVNSWTITKHFNYAFRQIVQFAETVDQSKPNKLLFVLAVSSILNLGHKLGFTWEQIEQAYFDKNQVNFNRQVNGY